MTILLMLAALSAAYANGANDNFKGVATLLGSGSLRYRGALLYATLATALGSVPAIVAGGALARSFSGRGLVPDALAAEPHFVTAVGGGAALTVLLAARLGMPISTTHALLGGLIGSGLASGAPLEGGALRSSFVYPLLLSPWVALLLTVGLHPPLRAAARRLARTPALCVCVGRAEAIAVPGPGGAVLARSGSDLTTGALETCRAHGARALLAIRAPALLGPLHLLSAGTVSFARGLNDTPKIAGLIAFGSLGLGTVGSSLAVGAAMAIGGLMAARRVAETMSHGITGMTRGQGLSANLATSILVVGASVLGLPVSTTHVSVGALFGIGLTGGRARPAAILEILLAWVVTLPCAALFAAILHLLVRRVA
ncbi:MAG: inorganic phosphate transporter [Candidatus Polarisedimenticolia bacterium]